MDAVICADLDARIEEAWDQVLSDPQRARSLNQEILDALPADAPPRYRGLALRNQAVLDNLAGRTGEAIEQALQASDLLRGAGDAKGASSAELTLCRVLGLVGLPDRAIGHAAKALVLSRQSGEVRGIAMAMAELARFYLQAGRTDEARSLATEAIDHAENLADQGPVARALVVLGRLAQAEGDLECAAARFTRAEAIATGTQASAGMVDSAVALGKVLMAAGKAGEAIEALERASRVARQHGLVQLLADAAHQLGRAYIQAHQIEAGCKALEEVIALCGTDHSLPIAVASLRELAAVRESRGDLTEALENLKHSVLLERTQKERDEADVARRVALAVKTSATERDLEISSRILEGTLPAAIVDELKRHGRVRPVVHEATTVLFTDLVGFTRVAEKFGPEVLVDSLDELFGSFDAISARWGVEKIKTIGDAYMACAGVPVPLAHHALAATMAALEMREVVRATGRAADASRPEWGIRIGLHSGSVLAGIIGKAKLAYDIWGDSVNTAARVESSGQPDHINVSSTVATLIEPWFVLQQRGLVAAKNKGDLEMAFVMGLKPEFAQDPHGLVPTEAFVAMVLGDG